MTKMVEYIGKELAEELICVLLKRAYRAVARLVLDIRDRVKAAQSLLGPAASAMITTTELQLKLYENMRQALRATLYFALLTGSVLAIFYSAKRAEAG